MERDSNVWEDGGSQNPPSPAWSPGARPGTAQYQLGAPVHYHPNHGVSRTRTKSLRVPLLGTIRLCDVLCLAQSRKGRCGQSTHARVPAELEAGYCRRHYPTAEWCVMRCAYAYASRRARPQRLSLPTHALLSIAQNMLEIPSCLMRRKAVVLISYLHLRCAPHVGGSHPQWLLTPSRCQSSVHKTQPKPAHTLAHNHTWCGCRCDRNYQ